MEAWTLSRSTQLHLFLTIELQFQLENEKTLLELFGPGLTCTSLLRIITRYGSHIGIMKTMLANVKKLIIGRKFA